MPRKIPKLAPLNMADEMAAVKLQIENARLAKLMKDESMGVDPEPTTFLNMTPPNDEEIAQMRAELIKRYDRLQAQREAEKLEGLLKWQKICAVNGFSPPAMHALTALRSSPSLAGADA